MIVHPMPGRLYLHLSPARLVGIRALRRADYQLTGPDGKQKDVELGAALWIYLDPWLKLEQP